jgi:ribosomal-protein-alanine N-acetyltransferase
MMQKVEILPARAEDLPQIAAMAACSFPDPWSEALFRQTLAAPASQILAAFTETGSLAGYLVLQQAGDEQSVDEIAVVPAFRRKGIARQLLQWAHHTFPACNFILEVRQHNTAALALYQQLGYQQVGLRKRYYHHPEEDAVLMTRYAAPSAEALSQQKGD